MGGSDPKATPPGERRVYELWSASFWWLQTAGWIGYWVLLYLTFLPIAGEGTCMRLMHVKLVRALFGFGLTSLARLVYRRVARTHALGPIIATALIGSTVLGSLWALLYAGYTWLVDGRVGNMHTELAQLPRAALDCAVTLLGWSALYFGIKHWRAFREAHERALHADLLAQQARLATLQYQLQPHFLFNTLNSIRTLVDEDAGRAKHMVTEVSEFLRYSLERAVATLVPLGNEVAAVRSYLEIEAIRFEDKLEVGIDVEPAIMQAPVPPFVLLPLVENAIKHGFERDRRPLRLRITARRDGDGNLRLEVANSGRWRPPRANGAADRDGTGTGLRNLGQRLQVTLPGQAQLHVGEEDGWVRAVVILGRVDESARTLAGAQGEEKVARASGR